MTFSHWRQRPRMFWAILVGALIGLDQLTKAYFSNTIALGDSIYVTDWFNFVHTLNRGAAFSITFLVSSPKGMFLLGFSVNSLNRRDPSFRASSNISLNSARSLGRPASSQALAKLAQELQMAVAKFKI